MDNEIYVSCHAPSLSLLLFETVRSVHDQKGLLIGEICKEVITEKTDENEMNREQRTTIYLEHCIPIKDNDFFGHVGNVNKMKMQKYIEKYCDKVVGWYSFRRNTRVHSRTLHEVLIHKALLQTIQHIKPEFFVAAFLSASVGTNFSTHTYNHIFTRFHPARGTFEPLKFKIYTMSDKIISINGCAVKNTFPVSKHFENISNSTEEKESPVLSILTINNAIGECLKLINKNLQESELKRSDLEQQIQILRKNLSLDKLEEMKVEEVKRESRVLRMQCLRYDSNINYNPNRKDNPIKEIVMKEKPRVPEEAEEVQLESNESEVNNSASPWHLPGAKDVKVKENTFSDSSRNTSSFSNHCNQLTVLASNDLDVPKAGTAGDSNSNAEEVNECGSYSEDNKNR